MFSIQELYKNIYQLNFSDHIDLCAHFMRYQEYYENSDPNIYMKDFCILDLITNLAKQDDEMKFTYFHDWSGFNLPDYIIFKCYENIPDRNRYDELIHSLASNIKNSKNGPFYFIGTSDDSLDDDSTVLDHEISHALFYTNHQYLKDQIELFDKMIESGKSGKKYKELLRILKEDLHYNSSVIYDEAIAYLSTGLADGEMEEINFNKSEIAVFKKNFKS